MLSYLRIPSDVIDRCPRVLLLSATVIRGEVWMIQQFFVREEECVWGRQN